jgi:anti-anti-sigma factor
MRRRLALDAVDHGAPGGRGLGRAGLGRTSQYVCGLSRGAPDLARAKIASLIDTEVVVPAEVPPTPFSLAIHRSPVGTHIIVGGELDRVTAPQLSHVLDDHLSDRGDLVLDLSDVTFIDLGGVAAVWSASCMAAGHGRRLDVRLGGCSARIFRLIGLERPLAD